MAAQPAYASGDHHAPPQLHVIKTLTTSVIGPLQFAVDGRRVYVADSATSTLTLVGQSTPIATGPDPATGGDLSGVAVDPDHGTIAYTTSTGDHTTTALTILRPGKHPVVADLSGFERTNNPDQNVTYGFETTPNAKCAAEFAAASQGQPPTYTGQIDSHPYAVASLDHQAWAVADAGGNDLLKVDRHGNVSLIAVLPKQRAVITAEVAKENEAPDCAGLTFDDESVPTDVEVGPDGQLYVTLLPGGIGATGAVYRVDPRSGCTTKIAGGFAAATNLAIDPHGTIYVAELGAGRISVVSHGGPQPVVSLPNVVAVEWANGHLYASTSPAAATEFQDTSPGSVVELGYGPAA